MSSAPVKTYWRPAKKISGNGTSVREDKLAEQQEEI
jgi:hypothetical protein